MNAFRIHYLQHVAFEGPGYIADWARQNGPILSATHYPPHAPLPALEELDRLMIMGGPMGVYEADRYPWLQEEKQFIRSAIEAGKTVIGICLGAQLIAEVLGAKVYPGDEKEIGWFPVSLTEDGKHEALLAGFPDSFYALHWHGDTFDLPPKARHLMQTDACPHQAFLYGDRVLGLQFHPEATPETLGNLIRHGRHELIPGTFVQDENAMMKNATFCHQANLYLAQILDRLPS